MHIKSLILATLATIGWAFASVTDRLLEPIRDYALFLWPGAQPVLASEVIAVEAAVRGDVSPAPLERMRAFLKRALNHPAYSAGHFDPGRLAGAVC